MRRTRRSPLILAAALAVLCLLAQKPALAGPSIPAGFDLAAFRQHFIAGLQGRPNTPPLTPESVRVDVVEKAATFGGLDIYQVKGELAPEGGQRQPFTMSVSADGQFYVSDIIDMRAGKSILKDARDRMRAEEVKTLGHTVLTGTGSVVVTYVSDPFCPYCRTGFAYLMGKTAAFSEFKLAHYPLPSHPGADIACALMAWAYDKAPKKALDFVRFAYTDLPVPKVEGKTPENLMKAWVEVASAFLKRFPEVKALGKDGPAVVKALGASVYVKAVQEDLAKAASMDISGTPIIFIGSTRVEGFDEPRLDALLK